MKVTVRQVVILIFFTIGIQFHSSLGLQCYGCNSTRYMNEVRMGVQLWDSCEDFNETTKNNFITECNKTVTSKCFTGIRKVDTTEYITIRACEGAEHEPMVGKCDERGCACDSDLCNGPNFVGPIVKKNERSSNLSCLWGPCREVIVILGLASHFLLHLFS